jgi:GNAT superfamily N-acetyltransferase
MAAGQQAMVVDIRQETFVALGEYASIRSTYEVCEILAPTTPECGMGGIGLTVLGVATPYLKDYDADSRCSPRQWSQRFDVTSWGIWIARDAGQCVGGAVVALNTPELESRDDTAVLWDLRTAPEKRRRGVATGLFCAAEVWARSMGARWLKVETQNVNVPACRFYVQRGCALGAVHRFAYPSLPDEVQLLWYKRLSGSAG